MSHGQAYANDLFAIDASENARAAFMRRTYIHLFGAILGFIGLEALFFQVLPVNRMVQMLFGNGIAGAIVLVVAFLAAGWIARYWAHNSVSRTMQYAGLSLYVVAQAIILLPALALASLFDRGGANIIPTAGIITLLIFGGLTTIVLLSGADFSFLYTGLMIATWSALIIMIASLVMGFNLGLIFMGAMVVLACGFILFDTSIVLHHYRTDQHVGAALELFASIAYLFSWVLRILLELYISTQGD